MITQDLENLGYTTCEAVVIQYLLKNADKSQLQIEKACNINQPGVSLALSGLKKRGMVTFTKVKPEGKGRETKLYSLIAHRVTGGPLERIEKEYKQKIELFNKVEKFLHDSV